MAFQNPKKPASRYGGNGKKQLEARHAIVSNEMTNKPEGFSGEFSIKISTLVIVDRIQ